MVSAEVIELVMDRFEEEHLEKRSLRAEGPGQQDGLYCGRAVHLREDDISRWVRLGYALDRMWRRVVRNSMSHHTHKATRRLPLSTLYNVGYPDSGVHLPPLSKETSHEPSCRHLRPVPNTNYRIDDILRYRLG